MGTQRLESDGAGRPVLRKLGAAGPEADRLRHEADALRAAAHPGVVQLLGLEDGDDGSVALRLAVAGTRTLADLRTDLPAAARALAGLATTVADLHDLGLVHGRIRADHVVLDGAGRAVLCGFAEAGPRGVLDPADDVHGLGTLLASILQRSGAVADGDWEPIPERRFGRSDRWSGFVRRALLTLADQATADDPAQRPTARGFAASVLTALPEPTATRPSARVALSSTVERLRANLVGGRVAGGAAAGVAGPGPEPEPLDAVAILVADEQRDAVRPASGVDAGAVRRDLRLRAGREPAPPDRTGRGLGRHAAPVAAAVGLGLLVFGVGALLRPAPVPRPSAAPASTGGTAATAPTTASTAAGRSTSSAPSTAAVAPPPVVTAATAATACGLVAPPAADPDGDGCASTAHIGDGVVEVDGVRYGVGRPGDLLAVGDWDCDGHATVALVHRGSGEVFLFDGWATGGAEATAASQGTVAGAAALEAPTGADGCARLVVVDGRGERTEVPA